MNELATNLTSDHVRFKEEIKRANDLNIKVVVLCEHGGNIKCLDDVRFWYNPRLKKYPKAPKGSSLYKTMKTMEQLYDVEFLFCNKKETGLEIAHILENGGVENDSNGND